MINQTWAVSSNRILISDKGQVNGMVNTFPIEVLVVLEVTQP